MVENEIIIWDNQYKSSIHSLILLHCSPGRYHWCAPSPLGRNSMHFSFILSERGPNKCILFQGYDQWPARVVCSYQQSYNVSLIKILRVYLTFIEIYNLIMTFATRADQRQQVDEASSELVQKNGMESEKMRSTIWVSGRITTGLSLALTPGLSLVELPQSCPLIGWEMICH